MDNIISAIIAMDQQARAEIEEAQHLRKLQMETLKGDESQIQGELLEKARHRIELIKSSTHKEYVEEASSIAATGQMRIEKLEEYFAQNGERLEDMIFNRCIGAEGEPDE